MKPSGSKTDLLLACGSPFNGQEWPEQTTGEAAEIGTVFHAVVAKMVNDHCSYESDAEALREGKISEPLEGTVPAAVFDMRPADAAESIKYLDFARAEVSYAWDWQTGRARELGVDIGRNYDLRETEIGCSLDITGEIDGCGYVLDWKTGREAPPAVGNGQLLFGAMCLSKVHGWDEVKVCIAHVKPDGQIWRDNAEVDSFDLLAFEAELKAAILAAPNARAKAEGHCKYCPVLAICPRTLEVIEEPDQPWPLALRATSDIQSVEHAAWLLHRVDAAKDLLKSVEAKIKEYADKTPIPLANGKVWGPWIATRESIVGTPEAMLAAGIPEKLIKFSVAKGEVEDFAKEGAEKGKGAQAVRTFLEKLRDAGLIKQSQFTQYEARKA